MSDGSIGDYLGWSTPAFIADETEKWGKVIRAAHIKVG
jgi:hypothetical protein